MTSFDWRSDSTVCTAVWLSWASASVMCSAPIRVRVHPFIDRFKARRQHLHLLDDLRQLIADLLDLLHAAPDFLGELASTCSCWPARSGRACASCRRRAATPTTTWCVSTGLRGRAAASRRTCRCSAATTEPRSARAPARPGPDLRRRGQRAQPARRLAGPRPRLYLPRGVGARVILCGVSAGSLCWFAEGVTGFHGPARASPASGSSRAATPSTTKPSAGARTSTARRRATAWRPGSPPSDGAALHFPGERLLQACPRARTRGASGCAATRRGARRAAALTSPRCAEEQPGAPPAPRAAGTGAATRRGRRDDRGGRAAAHPRAGRGRLHQLDRGLRRSTQYLRRSRRSGAPRVCLLPTASGDPERADRPLLPRLPRARSDLTHLSLFRLGSHASTRGATCSPGRDLRGRRHLRTCSQSGACTGSTSAAEAWERGILLAA